VCSDFLYNFCLKHFPLHEEFSELLSHVKYSSLSDFHETWIFSTDFQKTQDTGRQAGIDGQTGRQAGRHRQKERQAGLYSNSCVCTKCSYTFSSFFLSFTHDVICAYIKSTHITIAVIYTLKKHSRTSCPWYCLLLKRKSTGYATYVLDSNASFWTE
jgi:hypothetical protein